MRDIYHPFAEIDRLIDEIDRLNVELEQARDGARIAMTQCSNAQAEITKLRDDHAHSMSNLNEVILHLYNRINALRAELEQARAWAAAWKRRATFYRHVYKIADAIMSRWYEVSSVAESALLDLRRELSRAIIGQPCGHALGLVEHDVDCDYCQACADSGAIEAQLRTELAQARSDVVRKDAALDIIGWHLPWHDIDEYGYHSPSCDACAIQAELEKAA